MKLNKEIFCLIAFLLIGGGLSAQEENTIVFSYDAAGNMIERKLQVVMAGRLENAQKRNDTSEIIPAQNFKIFPNPTNQYLNIEGDLPKDFTEAKINLLSINGQILKEDTYVER